MSTTPARRVGWGLLALCSVAAGLLLSAAVSAQDLLDQQRRSREVRAQKLETEVAQALRDARRLEDADAPQALAILRRVRTQLEDDNALSDQRRGELLRQLDLRVRGVNDLVRQRQDAADRAATQSADRQLRPPQGGTQPPTGGKPGAGKTPFDQAKGFITKGRDTAGDAARYKADREAGVLATHRDIQNAAVPVVGDRTYPSYWKDLIARRKPVGGPEMTDKEKEVFRALNSTLSVNFDKTVFRDVISYLQDKTGLTILLDREAMREAGVEYDDPVSFSGNKLAVRTTLKKVLGDRGLTYIVKDATIQVVTPQKARETLVTYSYPIGDLLPAPSPFGNPLAARAQRMFQVQQIIEMIVNSTEPGTWAANGGPGTISFNEITNALVIRQSAEWHAMNPFGKR